MKNSVYFGDIEINTEVFRMHLVPCASSLSTELYAIIMYLIRTFLRKNYTFCAFRKLLIDKHAGITCCLHKFHRHSHCKRDFSTSSFLRCKLSRKSGNIEDILIKDVALETLVDPTGSGRDMTGDLDSGK